MNGLGNRSNRACTKLDHNVFSLRLLGGNSPYESQHCRSKTLTITILVAREQFCCLPLLLIMKPNLEFSRDAKLDFTWLPYWSA